MNTIHDRLITFDATFNVNDRVRVKLTDHGRAVHRADEIAFWQSGNCPSVVAKRQIDNYTPPVEDADGWSSFVLWDLMNRFGKHMGMGFQVPFETDIRFGVAQIGSIGAAKAVDPDPPPHPMDVVRAMCR